MIYKGEKLETMGKIFDKALHVPEHETEEFFTEYVKWIMESDKTQEEATEIAKSNLGYFAGYCDNETRSIIEKKYSCIHPVFGGVDNYISNDTAFELGRKGVSNLFEQPE